jgi:predicted metal-dependent phosphoesterase TrpH
MAGRAETDLHMHTVFSDGSAEPEALLQALVAKGIKTAAVTDHDTTAGFARLQAEADKLGLDLIPGIEINTHWKSTEVHILGYYIDSEDDGLQEVMKLHQANRRVQIRAMVERIQKMTNTELTVDDVMGRTHPQGSPGRPHIAKALVESKTVKTLSEAFAKFLGSSSGTYVNRPTVSPHEAVEAIYNSGGIPVVAHPGLSDGIADLVPELLPYGLHGLEAYHKSHSPAVIEYVCNLAEKYDLIVTGGTDFHGLPEMYPNAHNRLIMPNHIIHTLKALADRRRRAAFKVS